MTHELRVRDFALDDVPNANALTNHFIAHTAIHFGTQTATDEQFGAMWQKGVARFPWLSAEVDGRFAGYCKAGVWRERDAYARTVETGVYVTEEARGRGVGTALYEALFVRLEAAGFHAVVAGITLPNDASVRLHEVVGFTKVGVFRAVGNKFGAWHDVGFWELQLPRVATSAP